MMKYVLVIGAGGVGGYCIENIADCMEKEQIDSFTGITVADQDMVEIEQIRYQNFEMNEVGKNKAQALADRYIKSGIGIRAITKRIVKESQLKDYDIIILCVDNEKTREMIIKYCHKNDKEFLDLRATGRRIFAMSKERTLEDNLKFVDSKDMKEYSCQDRADLKKGHIQLGNRIIALWGTQMLLNLLRGHDNRTFTAVV